MHVVKVLARPRTGFALSTPWGTAMSRADRRCEVCRTTAGVLVRCSAAAVDVVDDSSSLFAVCTPCRLFLKALTAEEKRQREAAFRAKQTELFKGPR